MKELKFCPHCVSISNVEMRYTSKGASVRFRVVCLNCKMRGPVFSQQGLAIDGWNALPREGYDETT